MTTPIGAGNFLPALDITYWNGGDLQHKTLSLTEKVAHYTSQLFRLGVAAIMLPVAGCYLALRHLYLWATTAKSSPLPPKESPAKVKLSSVLPEKVGYAFQLFQDGGVGTRFSATKGLEGQCQWDDYLTPKHIDNTREGDFERFFVDILGTPAPWADILDGLGSNACRFSLEWSIIQPKPGGEYNRKALDLYHQFIKELLDRGIEPDVTLHHFTHPTWFEEMGAFKHEENGTLFKQYALDMMEEFPEIKTWYTINEPGALTLECLLKDHPSSINTIDQAGRMIRNLLITHCQIYSEAKQRKITADIGITHQWLKFYGINQNPLENAVCSVAAKITHWAIYNFFKTGQFSFEVPLQSNLHFSIDPEIFQNNNGFLDHIGVQFYGPAHIILGSNGGKKFPGHRVHNIILNEKLGLGLSFGGTCPPGKRVMSFGPTIDPSALTEVLQEASELPCGLKNKIRISELGVDRRTQGHGDEGFIVNDKLQKEIFKEYGAVLEPFKDKLEALFIWTLQTSPGYDGEGRLIPSQIEWQRGAESGLGVCVVDKDEERKPTGKHDLHLAGKLLQNAFFTRESLSNKSCPLA